MDYIRKCLRIYRWNVLQWVNRRALKTYLLIEDRARCEDCGRNVHDWTAPDGVWLSVVGPREGVVLCYDCFCNRGDELGIWWRMVIPESGPKLEQRTGYSG